MQFTLTILNLSVLFTTWAILVGWGKVPGWNSFKIAVLVLLITAGSEMCIAHFIYNYM